MKLWGGRFTQGTNKLAEEFLATLPLEPRLALHDIAGSMAHVKMLARQKIISESECESILSGLADIKNEFLEDRFVFDTSDEDIHMAIEKRLTQIIGAVAGKLHTARSRNDQIALDERLYLREFAKHIGTLLGEVKKAIFNLASAHQTVIMPGFTHLQTAQPVLFSHWIMAYFWMFERDSKRLESYISRLNECPLGACALAGTTFETDRFFTAKLLDFEKPTANSLDSVSDRDYVIEFCSFAAIVFVHLSRLCEELILFNSNDYKFIDFSDEFCTGSSIMPQKKNPDICEKMRGKTGRIFGNLSAILTIMKGLPLAYNTDMSEDKAALFDTCDTLEISLELIAKLINDLKINEKNMLSSAKKGYCNATDLADYLAKKGVAFREAHEITGKIVGFAITQNLTLDELKIEQFKEFCEKIDEDIYEAISLDSCVNLRNSYGGTSKLALSEQLKCAKELI